MSIFNIENTLYIIVKGKLWRKKEKKGSTKNI